MSAPSGRDLAGFLEATLLRADATGADIDALCREAVELGVGAVVVPSLWIGRARQALGGVAMKLVSVAGFPLGASRTEVKVGEAAMAFDDGADEVDFVMSIGLVKAGEFAPVLREFEAMVTEARRRARSLKVILECSLIDEAAIRAACRLAVESGIGFVKTSTGYGPRGATVEDVRLLADAVRGRAGVKAAGGIRTRSQAQALLDAGAIRLGTSAAGPILRGHEDRRA